MVLFTKHESSSDDVDVMSGPSPIFATSLFRHHWHIWSTSIHGRGRALGKRRALAAKKGLVSLSALAKEADVEGRGEGFLGRGEGCLGRGECCLG
ncbi:unnamed protein product [Lupinus luteus]|uniref:Uncharacterized protein n=1 Tax=Lupinus luteus TaxID=3873 RepID=A0AAV1WNL2_LUPLU